MKQILSYLFKERSIQKIFEEHCYQLSVDQNQMLLATIQTYRRVFVINVYWFLFGFEYVFILLD